MSGSFHENQSLTDISSLTHEVQRLGDSSTWWAEWGMILVGIGVVVAALIFAFQYMALRSATSLNDAQSRLAKEKEAAVQLELKDKDVKIGQANATADGAKRSTEELQKQNLQLRGQVANLQTKAAEAKTNAAESLAEATKAMGLALDEAWDRMSREADFRPRTIDIQKLLESSRDLRKYAGTKYVIVTLPENEPWRLGKVIDLLLTQSGWERDTDLKSFPESDTFKFEDGVYIETLHAARGETPAESSPLRNAYGPWKTHCSKMGSFQDR